MVLLKIKFNIRNVFICMYFLFLSLCLQVAALASDEQVELYRRLSFERGGC